MKQDRVSQKEFARSLRSNPTDAEHRLWQHLRAHRLGGCKFRRQVPIGPYVADFLCYERRLVIELDGGQHAEEHKNYDRARDAELRRRGFTVLRFWNNDVLSNTEGVLSAILRQLAS